MGRFTAYDQNGHMVADFDKSDYDFLCRYGRTPEEVMDENEGLRKERDFYFQQVTENGEQMQRAIDALNAENAKLRKENDTLTRRIDELCMEVERLRRDQGEWDGDTLVLTLKRDPSSIHVRLFAGRLAPRRVYKAKADLLAERTAKRIVVSDGGVGHAECSACGGAIDQDDAWCRHCGARMEGE